MGTLAARVKPGGNCTEKPGPEIVFSWSMLPPRAPKTLDPAKRTSRASIFRRSYLWHPFFVASSTNRLAMITQRSRAFGSPGEVFHAHRTPFSPDSRPHECAGPGVAGHGPSSHRPSRTGVRAAGHRGAGSTAAGLSDQRPSGDLPGVGLGGVGSLDREHVFRRRPRADVRNRTLLQPLARRGAAHGTCRRLRAG